MRSAGRVVAVCLFVSSMVAACSGADANVQESDPATSNPPPAATSTPAPSGPTFHKDVEPILQAHCQKCHTSGGLAPFTLLSYADAKNMAPAIVAETAAKRMPPWGAQDTSECKPRLPWRHDERLEQRDIDILAQWDKAGAPEGDPKDAPPSKAQASLELRSPTDTLVPRAPFVASGDRDQFRCFVLDHPYANGAYVTGVHVIPGNPKVVHHAVVFTDPGGRFSAQAGPDGSFECGSAAMMQMAAPGGPQPAGGQQSTTLDVWTPGNTPIDLPSNIAIPLTPGSRLVMQIHYSPGGTTAAPDLTKVQLRAGFRSPEYLLFTTSLGNYPIQTPAGDGLMLGPGETTPRFEIPHNARAHVERMQITLQGLQPDRPIWVYGVMAHEHLAGTDVKVDLDRGSTSQCLLQDKWDFHWQRMYTYEAPVSKLPALQEGDRIRLRCTYDNSMSNRRLAKELTARGLQPMDLHLGEQTLDEMCLVIPQLLVRNE